MYLLRYLMMMMTTMILTGSSRHIHFRTSESVEPGSDSTVEDFNRVLTRCKRNEGVRGGGGGTALSDFVSQLPVEISHSFL